MRAVQEAKDALIRAAARLTGERVDTASLAEAFTELAGSIAWLTRIPGAHAIAHDFARMLVDKMTGVREVHRASRADDVRQSLDLEAQERRKCPYCGKEIPNL